MLNGNLSYTHSFCLYSLEKKVRQGEKKGWNFHFRFKKNVSYGNEPEIAWGIRLYGRVEIGFLPHVIGKWGVEIFMSFRYLVICSEYE